MYHHEHKCNSEYKDVVVDFTDGNGICNFNDYSQGCYQCKGILYGKVSNRSGRPIRNALVTLRNEEYNIIFNTKSDSNGDYFFYDIPIFVVYDLLCIAKGYKISDLKRVSLIDCSITRVNIVLRPKVNEGIALVTGSVFSKTLQLPIKDAVAILYEHVNDDEIMRSIAYTNKFGEFIFTRFRLGNYTIKVIASGHTMEKCKISITSLGQILKIKFKLDEDKSKFIGTVSGVITDENNKPLEEADVVLYKVNKDKSLTPIAFTRTNNAGVYLFGDIPVGEYKIKSSQQK